MNKQSISKNIFKNTIYLSLGEIFVRIFTFLTVIYLARVLGTEGFGKSEFSFAVLSYFSLFALLGLNTWGNRETAKNPDKISTYLSNIILIQCFGFLISIILLFLFITFSGKDSVIKTLLLFQSFNILGTVLTVEWVFMGIKKMQYVAVGRFIRQFLYLLFVFFFIKKIELVIYLPILYFMATIGNSIYLWFLVLKKEKIEFKPKIQWTEWKIYLKESLPMMGSYLLTQAYYNLDIVFLGFLKSDNIVGLYSGAYKIVGLFVAIRLMFSGVLFPFFSQLFEESKEKLLLLIKFIEKISIIMILPITIISITFAKDIIQLIYDVEFENAILPFQILMLLVIFEFLNISFPILLNASGKQNLYFKIVFIISTITIILYLLIIPQFGMVGAAIITVLSGLLSFLWFYFESYKIIKINIIKYLFVPLFGGICMVILFFVLKNYSIVLQLFFGSLVYTIIIILFKYFSRKEVYRFKMLFFNINGK